MHSRAVVAVLSAGLVALAVVGCGVEEPEAGAYTLESTAAQPLTAGEVLPVGPTCTPNGAHAKHAFTGCRTCHSCGGVLQFSLTGPAISNTRPPPTFDATAKTCQNTACHGVAPGTFTYPFQGGDGEVVWTTVSYGSSSESPYWYSTSSSCTGCHGNPPRNGVWHSGRHANQGPSEPANQCQFCHPDAVSTNGTAVGLSTATNCGPNGSYGLCSALHANGTLEVQPKFRSSCFNCH